MLFAPESKNSALAVLVAELAVITYPYAPPNGRPILNKTAVSEILVTANDLGDTKRGLIVPPESVGGPATLFANPYTLSKYCLPFVSPLIVPVS
jgi:hypothetical protein